MKKAMVIVAVAFAVLVALVPLVHADDYYHIPDGKVVVSFKVYNDSQNGLYSHFNPGKKAYIDVYVNNRFKPADDGGARNLYLSKFFYKNDWDAKWIEDKETENNENYIRSSPSGNSTAGVSCITIDIPKNATIGNHTLSVKMQFRLIGDGWDAPTDITNYVYANYTYTVSPSSDAGSNSNGQTSSASEVGGMPLWEVGAIAVVVVVAVVVATVIALRKR